jgi:hypothetical protein
MAYQIDRYNNTVLTIVEDGTVDQSTDLKFIGKNYAGYGEIQNENFLYLLENFAGANQPPRAISGQIWFDTANSKLKFYDGTQWRTTGGSAVGGTAPTGLTAGDFWWDSANDQLYVYNGTDFILIGPQNAGEGVTQMVSQEVLDLAGNVRTIIAATLEDNVVATISPVEFTLNEATPIVGFDTVKAGITLVGTTSGAGSFGYSDTAGLTIGDHRFWGTSSASLNLIKSDGTSFSADEVVTAQPGQPTAFEEVVEFSDSGLSIGDSNDFKLLVDGSTAVIQNETGIGSEILFKITNNTGALTDLCKMNITGLIPALDNTYDIGTSSLRWQDVYAVNFVGEATKATSLRVGSDFRTAAVSATNNTVAVRDGSGSIAANLFQGTATAARYADLAEKYTTDQEYSVGTVMAVGGEAETRASKIGDVAIGVISAEPAYMMNSELEGGQYIGLKGRVPVRVTGPVSKGQCLYVASEEGTASTIASNSMVGIALETNSDEGEKLVECVLKV